MQASDALLDLLGDAIAYGAAEALETMHPSPEAIPDVGTRFSNLEYRD